MVGLKRGGSQCGIIPRHELAQTNDGLFFSLLPFDDDDSNLLDSKLGPVAENSCPVFIPTSSTIPLILRLYEQQVRLCRIIVLMGPQKN